MKKSILTILLIIGMGFLSFSQDNCIDRIILHLDKENNVSDTIFCKILNTDQAHILIDNGYSISSIPLIHVIDTQYCFREMTQYEIFRYEGLDYVGFDPYSQKQTAGTFMKKAAYSMYIGTGLMLAGTGVGLVGSFIAEKTVHKNICYSVAGLSAATAIFFYIRGWDLIYRAGKIIDLNENTALYLNNSDGVGLSLRF